MKTGLKDLDKFAYDVVCNWHKAIGFNPVKDGVDYSQIIRFYLWDKVGRAIRIQHNIDFGETEIYKKEFNSFPFYYNPIISQGKYRKNIFKKEKLVFIPFVVPKVLIEAINKKKKINIISNVTNSSLSTKYIIKPVKLRYKGVWHIELYDAVLESLKKRNILLISEDLELLKKQIEGTIYTSDIAEQELLNNKPDALYVYSDNHPPFINYVLAAKKLGIPTFTYQHGLDCEHYFLDDSYADYVAVWSENRKKEYLKSSRFKAKEYAVIGKISANKPEVKKTIFLRKTILFITRPHKPIKCYSPSRNHLEGGRILKSILGFMIDNKDIYLVLKPHPLDNVDIYKRIIENTEIGERVEICYENFYNIVENCNVIVTEDSTAGVEALSYNKPCIHTHFANSKPVLPFLEYGAAFSGKSSKEIYENLGKVFELTDLEMEVIKKNQMRLVSELIPMGNINDLTQFLLKNI